MPALTLSVLAGLAVATLGGMAIGLERQWSGHAEGAQAHFGGIRTFTMLGALAGVAGWFSVSGLPGVAVTLLAAAAALIVIGYYGASPRDIDATTEVAGLVVLAAGTLAGAGMLALASGLVAATSLLLLEKSRVHAFVKRIDDESLRASARFAAMACIVLPLLPPGPYGPLDAVRPRELWAFVLFFSGLSFAGWLARRAVGPRSGLIVSAVLGGLVSSTSVTTMLAHESRSHPANRVLAAGAVAACTVMLLRVTVACAVLNPALALQLPQFVWPSLLLGSGVTASLGRRPAASGDVDVFMDSPLQLGAALKMAGLFQLVLFAVLWVQQQWSSRALVVTSMFVGLTDVDALTLSLARTPIAPGAIESVAEALVAGVIANTLLKMFVAAVVGRGAFRALTVPVLGVMALAMWLAILR
jgi:uncharacterized membrane protein (DUF4010 family)